MSLGGDCSITNIGIITSFCSKNELNKKSQHKNLRGRRRRVLVSVSGGWGGILR